MRSSGIEEGPTWSEGVPIRESGSDTHRKEGLAAETEAETRVTLPQARECLEMLEVGRD